MRGKEKTVSAPKKESAAASKPFIVLPPAKNTAKRAPVTASATATSTATANAGPAASSGAAAAQKTDKPSTTNAVPVNKKDSKTETVSPSLSVSIAAKAKKLLPWWKTVKPLAPTTTAAAEKPAQNKANKPVAAAVAGGAEKMLVSPETPWFDQFPKTFSAALSTTHKPVDARLLQEMQDAAKLAYAHEVSAYQSELRALGESTDAKWLNTVINSGTWSDKIAALALRVQESPFHNLEALDLLLGIAVKKDLRSAFLALEAVRDLLVNNLLPDRPLRDFASCAPLLANNSDVPSLQLPMLCWYEAQLKTRIAQVHNVLQEALKANITHFRRQGLEYTSELLTKKPEQEQRLLEMIVNKIGDSDGKISSKACELLKALLRTLPALKSMVVREVRVFIYRPNTKMTAIFTAVNLLTQVRLSAETNAYAQNKNKKNRTANPYEKARQQQVAQRTAHVHNASDRELALQLAECYLSLFEKATQAKEEGSRLLTVLLNGINRVFPFLTDQDKNHSSLAPYLDSIFRLVHTATSNATSTQALALLSQMVVASNSHTESEKSEADEERGNSLRNRFYVTLYNKLLATDAFQHTKNTLFLNLLYKSVKADPNAQRAKAFVKRITMCATECAPAMTAGLLFMVSEILSARPELKAMLTSNDTALPSSLSSSSSAAQGEEEGDDKEEKEKDDEWFSGFNANKRNPLYALFSPSSSYVAASTTPVLFEMSLLCHHVHPSVKAFAEALVHSPQQYISFQGDPLVEFSLLSFLHRFAYKNPKQKQLPSALSAAQAQTNGELPMNQVFADGGAMNGEEIAPEKHFFYKFFGERAALRAMGKSRDRKKKRGGDDDDEEDDSEGERERDSDAEDGEGIDEEEEVDRFADKLADELMKHDARTRGEDVDEDEDFGDDLEEDDLEEDDFEEEEEEEGAESDSDDSELVGKKSKKKKGKASAAIDFEEFLQAQKGKKKGKKKARKEEEDSDDDLHFDDGEGERERDSDEDDIAEPEAYLSDDDDNDEELMMMHDGDEEDEDEEPMFLQEDSDEEEEEEEDVRGKNKKNKNAKKGDKKKAKRERAMEEDDDDDADNAFADASLFEDQMEEIVSKFKAESSAQKIANKMRKQQSKQEEEKEATTTTTATATKAAQKKNKKRKLR